MLYKHDRLIDSISKLLTPTIIVFILLARGLAGKGGKLSKQRLLASKMHASCTTDS